MALVAALVVALEMNCSNSVSMQVHMMVHKIHHMALEVVGEQALLLESASSIHGLVVGSNIVGSNLVHIEESRVGGIHLE